MGQEAKHIDRIQRFISHALVVVKKNKYLPWGTYSGVLLDLSLGGVKIELTSDVEIKEGSKIWVSIPLGPLQIYGPEHLNFFVQIRWFDKTRYRFGGALQDIKDEQREVIARVIMQIQSKRSHSEPTSPDEVKIDEYGRAV